MKKDDNNGKQDKIAKTLYFFYVLSLIGAVVLIGGIIGIMLFFKPDQSIASQLTPTVTKNIEEPSRGAILAQDGRVFAISFNSYTIAMDCSVMKDTYANDKKDGAAHEKAWMEKARQLSEGLATFFPEKTAAQYYDAIRRDRQAGKRYRVIGTPVNYETLQRIKQLPLFNEGQYEGGLIVTKKEVRQYPYGTLARRAIGYVKDENATGQKYIGIEGKFNSKLHGEAGVRYTQRKDAREAVQTFDSTAVKAVDGLDVRTTLDVDIQDLVDRALRAQIDTNRKIEGGCAMVMDVNTGALRAMVNLRRDKETGRLDETYNYAIGRAGEPGSVFKAATLMTMLEDKKIRSLYEKVPTNGGNDHHNHAIDQHMLDYEREHHTKEIPIIKGLEVSSNYVFSYLAYEHYSDKPQEFLNKLYMYKLGEAFDFDIEGLASPTVKSSDDKDWSPTDLGSTAFGYAVSETPLHILTFYNAIANKGKMMKPYLVESIEKNGVVKEKLGPSILNASVCSRATADTLTAGLVSVVKNGTGTRLKNAKCQVAGKTGTARVLLDANDDPRYANKYEDGQGRKKNQATFVGFFPADKPVYSLIIVIYSVLDKESFYGGTYPALAAREIVDGIYTMDPTWRETVKPKGSVPQMKSDATLLASVRQGDLLPDFKGMGLSDAVFVIESMGLKCSYSGMGHVTSQSPQAGSRTKKGDTVTIVLK